MKRTIISVMAVATLGAGGFFGIKAVSEKPSEKGSNEEIMINYSPDFPYTEKLEDMVQASDLVVVGSYQKEDSTWNMARNPNDISKEDTENYVEGKLYQFKVDEILVGEAEDHVKVNLRYKELINVEDSEGKIHQVENIDPLYAEPALDERYILFLKKDHVFGHYYAAIEPFQIMINDEGVAEVKTNLTQSTSNIQTVNLQKQNKTIKIEKHLVDINEGISGMTLEELKVEIVGVK